MENDLITAAMVESAEFPQLATKYQVMAVPKVVINETVTIEGILPEQEFLNKILQG